MLNPITEPTARQVPVGSGILPGDSKSLRRLQISLYSQAAEQVTGDFFDFFRVSQSQWVLVMGDIAGKGALADRNMVGTSSRQPRRSSLTIRRTRHDLLGPMARRASFETLFTRSVSLRLSSSSLEAIQFQAKGENHHGYVRRTGRKRIRRN